MMFVSKIVYRQVLNEKIVDTKLKSLQMMKICMELKNHMLNQEFLDRLYT